MNKLTDRQQTIIDSLVSEFTAINKVKTKSNNPFAHLCVEADADNKRIAEIKAIDMVNKAKIREEIAMDLAKYKPYFQEIGLDLDYYPNCDMTLWVMCPSKNGSMKTSSVGWTYKHTQKCEEVLGERVWCVDGRYITRGGYYAFNNLDELFANKTFHEDLKKVIASRG
jgi:hypothetical protein